MAPLTYFSLQLHNFSQIFRSNCISLLFVDFSITLLKISDWREHFPFLWKKRLVFKSLNFFVKYKRGLNSNLSNLFVRQKPLVMMTRLPAFWILFKIQRWFLKAGLWSITVFLNIFEPSYLFPMIFLEVKPCPKISTSVQNLSKGFSEKRPFFKQF